MTLNGVSCATQNACQAVGSYVNAAGAQVALAESWDGTAWTLRDVPLPSVFLSLYKPISQVTLNGVSCTSRSACTAVGGWYTGPHVGTFAERWNGRAWTVQDAGGQLGGGDYGPQPLTGVSCSSLRSCHAVGINNSPAGYYATALSWDGLRWKPEFPDQGPRTGSNDFTNAVLNGVFCLSSNYCSAVGGDDFGPLVEVWNGRRWTIRSLQRSGGSLHGVWCHSRVSCAAVGSLPARGGATNALAERWNGSRWTIQRSANPGRHAATSQLVGVSCTGATAWCMAVGAWAANRRHAPSQTFAEIWNGRRWSVQGTPTPSFGTLTSVSCTADRTCIAVGSASGSARIERYGR